MKNITIAGGITRDSEMRRTQSGDAVLGFSVAVDDGFGDRKTTLYFECSLWGKRGDTLAPMLKKGTKVAVSGEFSTRIHEGKTYFTVSVQNVTLMSPKPAEQQGTPAKEKSYGEQSGGAPANFADDLDDAVPFEMSWR